MKVLVACEGEVREERACEARECPSFDVCKEIGWFWVPIEHKKPPRRDTYFIAYVFGDSDMHFYGAAMWHDDCPDNGYVQGDHFSGEGVYGMRVTHWARIPLLNYTTKIDGFATPGDCFECETEDCPTVDECESCKVEG